jgi:hypothetical protein
MLFEILNSIFNNIVLNSLTLLSAKLPVSFTYNAAVYSV